MKFMAWTHWVFRNLFRNRLRTVLTLGSVAVSLFLLAMLSAAYQFLNAPPTGPDQSQLLLVSPRAALTMPMPLSYKDRIAALPGVAVVSPFGYVGALYGARNDFIPAVALDPDTVLDFFGEWKIPESERQGFIREKTALIVGRKLAQKYGWKVGDHIHLSSPQYSNLTLEFTIQGIYESGAEGDESTVALHWDYLNDAVGRPNHADMFWVRARSAKDVPRLTRAIDAEFHNAPVETRTGTLKQFLLNFLNLLGNVKLMLAGISIAVVFAVMLVVANTMAMSVRERTAEMATLRAIGFRSWQLLRLMVGESALVSLAGAALACLAAGGLCKLISGLPIGGAMPAHLSVGAPTVLLVVAVALAISLLTTFVPAYRASQLNIAEALRYVG